MEKPRTWLFHYSALFACVTWALCSAPPSDAEPRLFAAVPALAVSLNGDQKIGGIHYIAIQLDRDPQRGGPTILFNEVSPGSAVGGGWKEGIRTAFAAAADALGKDPRDWTLTIKNHAYNSFTDGSSASGAVAVGIMAAWRGDTLRRDAVLTGEITADGRIRKVGSLAGKLEGAANAKMRMLLVPQGEARTPDWDLYALGRQRNLTVIEVGSLQEAYQRMTTQSQ